MGKRAFGKVRGRLTSKAVPVDLRRRFAKCFMWSGVLYGAETLTLRKKETKYLESYEIWLRRKMEKVKWADKVRNDEVLRKVGVKRHLMETIRKRKISWLGHILRRNSLQRRVIEGKIEGRKRRVRRRFGMPTDVKQGRSYKQLKQDTQDREAWRLSS